MYQRAARRKRANFAPKFETDDPNPTDGLLDTDESPQGSPILTFVFLAALPALPVWRPCLRQIERMFSRRSPP